MSCVVDWSTGYGMCGTTGEKDYRALTNAFDFMQADVTHEKK